MSELVLSATAAVRETALRVLRAAHVWPTAASGLACHILQRAGLPPEGLLGQPPEDPTAQLLRRTPVLAAYGYVVDLCSPAAVALWIEELEHLRGREIYPADRNSFIFNPVEILGVSRGVASERVPKEHREWLSGTLLRGFTQGQFKTILSQLAALSSLSLLDEAKAATVTMSPLAVQLLSTQDALAALCIDLSIGVPPGALAGDLDQELLKRLLTASLPVNDEAEAAALLVLATRLTDGAALSSPDDPVARIITVCRRFPLFADQLRSRQRSRPPFEIKDEYDVQDLLHAILKLHFDDVRPEEHTPSYAGTSSRVDFLLPKERVVVEAKMTRANLKQKEVADQLIVDAARYGKMPAVLALICLVYDPEKHCKNPQALESDVEASGPRLVVKAVVCPQGL